MGAQVPAVSHCQPMPPWESLQHQQTWGIFFGGLQHPPVNGCSTASCDILLLQEEMGMHVLLIRHLETSLTDKPPAI